MIATGKSSSKRGTRSSSRQEKVPSICCASRRDQDAEHRFCDGWRQGVGARLPLEKDAVIPEFRRGRRVGRARAASMNGWPLRDHLFPAEQARIVTSRCDWRIADLDGSRRPLTLYLVVPPSNMNCTKPLTGAPRPVWRQAVDRGRHRAAECHRFARTGEGRARPAVRHRGARQGLGDRYDLYPDAGGLRLSRCGPASFRGVSSAGRCRAGKRQMSSCRLCGWAAWRRKPKNKVLIHSDQGANSPAWPGLCARSLEHSLSRRRKLFQSSQTRKAQAQDMPGARRCEERNAVARQVRTAADDKK